MDTDADRRELERQWRIVQEWLLGSDARAAAEAELRGAVVVGLEADDLLADASVRLWRTLRAREEPVDDGDDGRGVIRYARRALRHAAIDAFRAAARRPEVPVPEPIEVPADDGDRDTTGRGWLHAVRRALHAEMESSPRAGAAALATAAVLADDLALAPDVPQPLRGATTSQAAVWAGLWFVEGGDLFPADPDAAARQRRSRASARVADLLERAITAADPGDHDG